MATMLKVSEAASLGLHTMALLATDPQRMVSSQEIAAVLNVSQAHLSKVMHRLALAGLVRAVRGPRGGFALTRPAEEVTLLEIYEAIEGPIEVHDCLYSTALCGGKACIFGGLLKTVGGQVREYLASTRLDQAATVVAGKAEALANR